VQHPAVAGPREAKLLHPGSLTLSQYTPRSQVVAPKTAVLAAQFPCIDAHNHLGTWLTTDGGWMTPDVDALLATMNAANVRTVVNLDGRWGEELEANLDRYDRAHPGRFVTFCQLDWSLLASTSAADAVTQLVGQLERSVRAGARGLKIWKELGLRWTDDSGALVLPDDQRLGQVFEACVDLALPIVIHVADPVAFFDPLDACNERLEDLADNADWWFGDRSRHPSFDDLIGALERLVAAHPRTRFVGAHLGCYAENVGWVDHMLRTYQNFAVDTGGRMAELGRQPRAVRALVLRYPDRVLFGSDSYPIDSQAYAQWFRFLESDNEAFAYEPTSAIPPMGRWDVSALDLPDNVLERVYRINAERWLGLQG
jgi:predicted TIM-barrel fold metal-dependent hydrolase